MVRLYWAAYCVRSCACNCPNRTTGRKTDQSTGRPRGGFRIPLKGLGDTIPFCPRKGVLNRTLKRLVLPPNGGSGLDCSSTHCSTRVLNKPPPLRTVGLSGPPVGVLRQPAFPP